MKSARVSRNVGAVHEGRAIAASYRLPVDGKLRAGVKILTADARKNKELVSIYNEGVSVGASFDEISSLIAKVKGAPRYPLRPANVAYFTARQGDFVMRGAAELLMEQYGEVRRGDPEKRLYTVPAVFPTESLDLIFREQFEAWRSTQLYRWSDPDPATGSLACMMREEVQPNKSAKRRWGGRDSVIEKPCEPNQCGLFASGECKHVASLYFRIPGLLGAGTIELTFTSIYASMGIAETIEMVRGGLGRVSGLNNGRPIFWLSKSLERVSRMNWATGKPEKTEQWIIRLDATGLDMMEALAGPAPADTTLALPASIDEPIIEPEPEPEPTPGIQKLHSEIASLRGALGWVNVDLLEWVAAQGYASHTPFHDVECLTDMRDKLVPLAGAITAEVESAMVDAAAAKEAKEAVLADKDEEDTKEPF